MEVEVVEVRKEGSAGRSVGSVKSKGKVDGGQDTCPGVCRLTEDVYADLSGLSVKEIKADISLYFKEWLEVDRRTDELGKKLMRYYRASRTLVGELSKRWLMERRTVEILTRELERLRSGAGGTGLSPSTASSADVGLEGGGGVSWGSWVLSLCLSLLPGGGSSEQRGWWADSVYCGPSRGHDGSKMGDLQGQLGWRGSHLYSSGEENGAGGGSVRSGRITVRKGE